MDERRFPQSNASIGIARSRASEMDRSRCRPRGSGGGNRGRVGAAARKIKATTPVSCNKEKEYCGDRFRFWRALFGPTTEQQQGTIEISTCTYDVGTMNDALVGKLVTIAGLQSEAGAPLNGSRGIVLDDPKLLSKQAGRLPVLLYAQGKGNELLVLEKPGMMRSIKEENLRSLEDQKCGAYKEFAFEAWEKAYRFDGKIDLALFHLKQYTQRWPDDYKMTVNYVNVLRQKDLLVPPFRRAATEKASADEAWKALCRTEPYLTDGSYTETHGDLSVLKGGRGSVVESSHVNQFYFDMVWTALSSGQESQVALDLALKITTENAHDMKMARDALEHISTTLRKRSPLNDNKADLEVNVRAMKALLELSPDDVELISWVAGAECMAGNNQEGAKWYRKAVERGCDCRTELSLAQIQCPGGPLEDHKILGTEDGRWTIIHKSKADDYSFERVSGMIRIGRKRADVPPIEEAVAYFPIPDPDDKVAFGVAQYD